MVCRESGITAKDGTQSESTGLTENEKTPISLIMGWKNFYIYVAQNAFLVPYTGGGG